MLLLNYKEYMECLGTERGKTLAQMRIYQDRAEMYYPTGYVGLRPRYACKG